MLYLIMVCSVVDSSITLYYVILLGNDVNDTNLNFLFVQRVNIVNTSSRLNNQNMMFY